jgi:hypothetical protein
METKTLNSTKKSYTEKGNTLKEKEARENTPTSSHQRFRPVLI